MPNNILSISDLETVTGGAIRAGGPSALGLGNGLLDPTSIALQGQMMQAQLLKKDDFSSMMPFLFLAMSGGFGHKGSFQSGPTPWGGWQYSYQNA